MVNLEKMGEPMMKNVEDHATEKPKKKDEPENGPDADQTTKTTTFRLSIDWENIFRKDDSKKEVKGHVIFNKGKEDFITGSSYIGQWDCLNMDGYGSFIYHHGCEYEGGFENGRFHGAGTISYPIGQKIDGTWFKGQLLSFKFYSIDELDNTESRYYCAMPDRRFLVSQREGLLPAGRERITNQQPSRPFPLSPCYDTADGFFNPATKLLLAARDPENYADLDQRESVEVIDTLDTESDDFWINAVNIVSPKKEAWIKEHCRKSWDEPAGYRPDLYEYWVSGRRKETDEIDRIFEEGTILENNFENTIRRLSLIGDVQRQTIRYSGTGRILLPKLNVA